METDHDTMRKALSVLYKRVTYRAGWDQHDLDTHWERGWYDLSNDELIPTDLASLLRLCREMDVHYELTAAYPRHHRARLTVFGQSQPQQITCENIDLDPTTALIHALAGLYDGKEVNRE